MLELIFFFNFFFILCVLSFSFKKFDLLTYILLLELCFIILFCLFVSSGSFFDSFILLNFSFICLALAAIEVSLAVFFYFLY